MTSKQFGALVGFLFVAAWIGFGFGDAILCLVGAVVFYLAAGVKDGEIDLAELQGRLNPQGSPTSRPASSPASPVPPSPPRARV